MLVTCSKWAEKDLMKPALFVYDLRSSCRRISALSQPLTHVSVFLGGKGADFPEEESSHPTRLNGASLGCSSPNSVHCHTVWGRRPAAPPPARATVPVSAALQQW